MAAVARQPGHIQALTALAALYKQAGLLQEASAALEAALTVAADDEALHAAQAAVLTDLGESPHTLLVCLQLVGCCLCQLRCRAVCQHTHDNRFHLPPRLAPQGLLLVEIGSSPGSSPHQVCTCMSQLHALQAPSSRQRAASSKRWSCTRRLWPWMAVTLQATTTWLSC